VIRWPWRRRAKPLGAQGEDLAARFLQREGYTILDRNLRLGRGEIDILARDGDTIAFVEVKTLRNADDTFRPEARVDAAKQRHLITAAKRYMATHPDPHAYYRFDVVSVVLPEEGKPEITLFRNAFEA
jgi:putative endonuclease